MNNSKKQTAMQKLIAYIEENYHLSEESHDQFKKALEEERLKNSQYSQEICDVCGSADVITVLPMGKNCNRCNPL